MAGREAATLLRRWSEATGQTIFFTRDALRPLVYGRVRWPQFFEQAVQIGVSSSTVIVLTSLFTGLVFALEIGYAFGLFQAEGLIGPSVVLTLTRQLSPVLTALMVIARAGSAMAAEIGTMRVTEQIDALHAMAIPPMGYLVLPRIMASTLMVPLLSALFSFVGFLGAYWISIEVLAVPRTTFIHQILINVDLVDIWSGLFKAMVFGFLMAIVCTSRGYYASGGAKGVGRMTTQAVVVSSALVLVADYFITAVVFDW